MDPTTCPEPAAVLPSSHSLSRSLLRRTANWRQSKASGWQQEVPHRMPWLRQTPALVNSTGMLQSRRRPASLAFTQHQDNRDQEPISKHFLSEDKMAARFNSLSLDNDHMYNSNGFPVQDKDPKWQQAYTRLKELQRRLSRDGVTEETSSAEEENECGAVIVDGEFIMPDSPLLSLSSLFQETLGGVNLVPEEVLLSVNPCTEVILWSPAGNSILHTLRTLRATPSFLGASTHLQQEEGATQEEMET